MKYLSICSGIEAATVAFHPLGWEPIAFSEIEAFPCAVLKRHYPTIPNLGDMTAWSKWDWELLAEADLLVGGTPCQAFSVAGLRAGLEDQRGQLTLSYIHILDHVDEIRSLYGKEPAICVWENVHGVLSSKDNAFGAFLGGLCGEDRELVPSGKRWSDAGCVYGPKRTVAWRVLDAQYFGVAQRRKRVFVIASARDIDPSEILFEFDSVRRDTPPSREAWKDITRSVGGSSAFRDTPILNDQGGSVMSVEDGLVGTLRRETHGHEPIVFEPGLAKRDGSENRFSEGVCGTLRAQMGDNQPAVAYSVISDPTPKVGEDICLTMRSQGGGGEIVPPSVAVYREGSFGQYNDDGTFATVKASGGVLGGGSETFVTYPIHDRATRHGGERGTSNGLGIGAPSDPCPTLDTGGNHAIAIQGSMIGRDDKNGLNEELNCVDHHAVACGTDLYNGSITGDIACTMGTSGSSSNASGPTVMEKMQVRRLTPTECERLQGFPDGHTYVPFRNKPASDGPRYKSLGNSMAVPVMHWIGKRIQGVIK